MIDTLWHPDRADPIDDDHELKKENETFGNMKLGISCEAIPVFSLFAILSPTNLAT